MKSYEIYMYKSTNKNKIIFFQCLQIKKFKSQILITTVNKIFKN